MEKIYNVKEKKTLRRRLRHEATPAEKRLWRYLQRSALGVKFRRQHGVGRYVLDFYCPELKLAIELEGGIHQDVLRSETDEIRHQYLVSQGIHVLYFKNMAVFEFPDFVVNCIVAAVCAPPGQAGQKLERP